MIRKFVWRSNTLIAYPEGFVDILMSQSITNIVLICNRIMNHNRSRSVFTNVIQTRLQTSPSASITTKNAQENTQDNCKRGNNRAQ